MMPTQRAANKRLIVYTLLTCVICLLLWRSERHDQRIDRNHRRIEGLVSDLQQVVADVEAESARTDLAFCQSANTNRKNGNDRARAIAEAVKIAFAGQPEIRDKILAEVPPDLPFLDCSGIGNRKEDLSKQPALNGFPVASTTTVPPVTHPPPRSSE